jgi:hypothetical protein
MKFLFALTALCVLTGNYAWAGEEIKTQGGQARVRFFGQAVIGLTFYENKSCYGGKGISASRTGFGGAFGSKKNISLGMPETPNVINLKARDGILASAFYREYSVNFGEPLTILASYQESTGRTSYSCKNFSAVFTPEEGKDYEVAVNINSDICKLDIKRIEQKDTGIQLMPVDLSEGRKCSGKDDK